MTRGDGWYHVFILYGMVSRGGSGERGVGGLVVANILTILLTLAKAMPTITRSGIVSRII